MTGGHSLREKERERENVWVFGWELFIPLQSL